MLQGLPLSKLARGLVGLKLCLLLQLSFSFLRSQFRSFDHFGFLKGRFFGLDSRLLQLLELLLLGAEERSVLLCDPLPFQSLLHETFLLESLCLEPGCQVISFALGLRLLDL